MNGALSSPIDFAAAGLPAGAVASFSPAYLAPSTTAAAVVLTVQTPRASLEQNGGPVYALLLPVGVLVLVRRRHRREAGLLAAGLISLVLLVTAGCGDRIYTAPAGSGVAYNVTVTATATGSAGAVLVHSVTVVLTVD